MKALVIALAAALLSGCLATTKTLWAKPGSTDDDFHRDQGQCQERAFSIPGGGLERAVIVYEACMRGRGWHQVPA